MVIFFCIGAMVSSAEHGVYSDARTSFVISAPRARVQEVRVQFACLFVEPPKAGGLLYGDGIGDLLAK